jgi:hypothetical protein
VDGEASRAKGEAVLLQLRDEVAVIIVGQPSRDLLLAIEAPPED